MKTWGSNVGFVISLSNISALYSLSLSVMDLQQADRERLVSVNEGLSPKDRIHTTYTWRGNMPLTHQRPTPSTSNHGPNYRLLRVMFAINMFTIMKSHINLLMRVLYTSKLGDKLEITKCPTRVTYFCALV